MRAVERREKRQCPCCRLGRHFHSTGLVGEPIGPSWAMEVWLLLELFVLVSWLCLVIYRLPEEGKKVDGARGQNFGIRG